MVAEQEAGVSNPSEVGQEVPVRPSHKHAGVWMGWMLNKRRLNMLDENVMMQLFLKDNMEI